MDQKKFAVDVLIIGGGIHGAGCAQALASRGYSTILIESGQIGHGTSSRSSKLIHGGLRYIETGQFSLVRKSLRERAILEKIAPDLIHSRQFLLPIYRHNRLKRWQLILALSIYSLLGGLNKNTRFKRLSKSEQNNLAGLKKDGLIAVYQYWDAQTNDLALTQAVIHSAKQYDCQVLEQTAFIKASQLTSKTLQVQARQNQQTVNIDCQLLVNASGPWIEKVQAQIDFARSGPEVDLVQGTHLEYDQAISDDIFYLESPDDHRPVFIMPWQGGTLIGTTEVQHRGNPANSQPTEAEIDYLKKILFHYFPAYQGQFVQAWSGLRVLPKHPHKAAVRRFAKQARETVLHVDNSFSPQVISIYGGKLTAYRATAKRVADLAAKRLGRAKKLADTSIMPLQSPQK
jgi:glycerol-3-phosphate dehydrogenase